MALTFAFRGPQDWDSDTKDFNDEESENLTALGMHLSGDEKKDEDEDEEDEPVEKVVAGEAVVVDVKEEDEEGDEELDELEELERLAIRLKEEEATIGLEEGEE